MQERRFVQQLQGIFEKEGYLTRAEISAGYGRSDLVLVRLNFDKCEIRRRNNQNSPLLKESFFHLLKNIPDPDTDKNAKPVDVDYLYNQTKFSKSLLKNSLLKDLTRLGYVREEKAGLYFKVNGWLPIAKEVIAIEAKMSDWKRGLYQATRYRSFADKVYLAIPPNKQHLVDMELLKRVSVGLIVFDPAKNEKICPLKSPGLNPVYKEKRDFVSEFFWGSSAASI